MSYEPPCLPSNASSISLKEFNRRIADFEERWIKHFEEIKTKPISQSAFNRLELEFDSELSELNVLITMKKMYGHQVSVLENKLNASKCKVLSYKEKARASSTSEWNLIEMSTLTQRLSSISSVIVEILKKIPIIGNILR